MSESRSLVVRAITAFVPMTRPREAADVLTQVREGLLRLKRRMEAQGFTVQTLRVTTSAFAQWPGGPAAWHNETAFLTEHLGPDVFVNIGQVDPLQDDPRILEHLPQLMAAFPVYASVRMVPVGEKRILGRRVWAAARLIHALAQVGEQGEPNTRFAAAAWVPAFTPFFPASFVEAEDGPEAWQWAVAMETGGLLYRTLREHRTPETAGRALQTALETEMRILAQAVEAEPDLAPRFRGVDLSWAPFPEPQRSVAQALAQWGLNVGWHGTLALSAWLTRILQRVKVPRRTGFFGLMLPVLEDPGLVHAVEAGHLDTRMLLMNSAVCAVGLDTVPLPGDTTEAQLATVLWDLAALAVRLEKPLVARLIPVPGHRAGERVAWNKPAFTPSPVLSLLAEVLPPLSEEAVLDLE